MNNRTKAIIIFIIAALFPIIAVTRLAQGLFGAKELITALVIGGLCGFWAYKLFKKPDQPKKQNDPPKYTPSGSISIKTQSNACKNELTFALAGVTHEGREDIIKDLLHKHHKTNGDSAELEFIPEPHPKDPNAIKVLWYGEHVGYVPQKNNLNLTVKTLLAKGSRYTWKILKPSERFQFYNIFVLFSEDL